MSEAKAPSPKLKTGPAPLGLGPPFTIRLTLDQDAKVRKKASKKRVSKGEVIREKLGEIND